MATQFCQKCKQSHPGRLCDYDERGECAETADLQDRAEESNATRSAGGNKTSAGSKQ